MGLAAELLDSWAPIFRGVELRSGLHGRFEVTLDGELVFSKEALRRHQRPGEVARIFEARLGPRPQWRKARG